MSGISIPITDKEVFTSLPMSAPAPTPVIAIGGDARQVAVIRALTGAGYKVTAVGLSEARGLPTGVRMCRHITRALADLPGSTQSEDTPIEGVLILPLPVSRDGENVLCPLDPEVKITLAEVADRMIAHPGLCLLGGCLPGAWAKELTEACGQARVIDYYDREDVQIKNARVTAEGAVMTAMELTDTALLGSRAAVIGYGRIGRYLATLLTALGVRVTVCARRTESLAMAACDGCDTLQLTGAREDLLPLCRGYDVIYNTVPQPLLGAVVLQTMDDRTLIMDLASNPGGVDPEAARIYLEQGSGGSRPRLIRAPSLPGRYAPETAGQIIADAVLHILKEGGR